MTCNNTKKNVSVFSRDVSEGGFYAYTGERLSSQLANERISKGVNHIYPVQGKKILDIGCGDGTYSLELFAHGAASVLGIDPSTKAIEAATAKAQSAGVVEHVSFQPGNIYDLALTETFDCMVLRGVLHHLPDAAKALQAIAPFASALVIVEPNGTNPVLKVIEKTSTYHKEHEEQSFLYPTIKTWLIHAGFTSIDHCYINLVPYFCPDWMAKLCKKVEPLVEAVPFVRNIACGQYMILAQK